MSKIITKQSDPALMELLRPKIESLVKTDVQTDVDREKTIQYANARRNDLYYAGKQYLVPVRTGDGSTVDWSPANGNMVSGLADGGRAYDYVLNFIRGDGDKAIAVLSQKNASVKGMPDRIDDPECHRRARRADVLSGILDGQWDISAANQTISLGLWKTGTMFLYTPFVANASRYGTTEEPIIEIQDQTLGEATYHCVQCGAQTPESAVDPSNPTCPQCGSPLGPEDLQSPEPTPVPVQTGSTQYANGAAELIIASIFEVTTPFNIKDLSEAPWLWYEYKTHKGALMATFPETREMFNDGVTGGESAISTAGNLARDIAASPSKTQGGAGKNQWLFTRYWLRPAMFELIPDGSDKKGGSVRQQLGQLFPDGLKITMVNGKAIRFEGESIEEVWATIKPRASTFLYADPLCTDYIEPQNVINDCYNNAAEVAERSIPFTLYDPMVLDSEMISRHRATPLEMIPAKSGSGGSLRESMFTPTPAMVNPETMKLGEMARDSARQIVGVQPAMFGGDEGHEQTAKEATMKRNQSLMQLNVSWINMKNGIARAKENAIVQMAKYSGGKIALRRSASLPPEIIEMPEIEDLAKGGWHLDAEDAAPMTWGERSDKFWSIIENPQPEIWKVLGISEADGLPDPQNVLEFQQALGVPDWKIPLLDDYYKAVDTIRLLSAQEPIMPPPPDPMAPPPVDQTGQPLPPPEPQPSIPADEFEDNHAFVAKTVQKWAQTEKARELRDTNPNGYANVIAWGKAHFNLANPPAPPPPPGGPGGPSGGPPSPGGPPPPDGGVPQGIPPEPQGIAPGPTPPPPALASSLPAQVSH